MPDNTPGAEPDPLAGSLAAPAQAPTFAERGDMGPQLAEGKYERPPLPPGCPVKPLGITSTLEGSQKCVYLDVRGQLVGLEANNRHGKNGLIGLFGDQSSWLEYNFPQWSAPRFEGAGANKVMVKPPEIVGFKQDDASRALIEQCVREGPFDATGKIRGRGAHRTPTGGLVIHCGNGVLKLGQKADGSFRDEFEYVEAGLSEGFVYPIADPSPRPWHVRSGTKPAQQLLKLLGTWHWKRELLDPRFLLGWIGAAMIGGALNWRPNVWITGGSGTGKSALNGENGVLDQIFGSAVVRTGSASAAAIRQLLKHSTVPVLFDEIEASADNRRVNEVVELARVSSSGATMHRGGADHQAHEFTLRSCFEFSSINIPPLMPQDRSRLALLELLPFGEDTKKLVLSDWNLPELARHLQRRMVDGWGRLEPTLAEFTNALMKRGHTRRASDQFGTLLAVAHILLNDKAVSEEELHEWVAQCAPDRISEISGSPLDHEACLAHLVTTMVQSRGGEERVTVASWISEALWAAIGSEQYEIENKAGERLQQRGLKVVNARWHPPLIDAAGETTRIGRWGAEAYTHEAPGFLAVAWSHRALEEIFANTVWQGGVWRQSLARFAGALEPVKTKFHRQSLSAVLVPLWALLDESDLPPMSQRGATEQWIDDQITGFGNQ